MAEWATTCTYSWQVHVQAARQCVLGWNIIQELALNG